MALLVFNAQFKCKLNVVVHHIVRCNVRAGHREMLLPISGMLASFFKFIVPTKEKYIIELLANVV